MVNENESEYIFLSIIYYFSNSLVYGPYDVLKKKYMLTFFSTPYFLMFVVGLIDMIVLIIFDLFVFFLDLSSDSIIIGFQKNIFNVSRFFLFILDIILI